MDCRTTRTERTNHSSRRARARRAFTLIEVLVSIGAIAVISVGLAAIFDSIGKTVSGGRRASVLNTYSQLIERQLADDFAHMTRDGFMVIRQQYVDVNGDNSIDIAAATNPDAVELYRDQPVAERRPRRIDELMFFSKGNYQSARRSMFPGVVATSQEARIYWGHLQRRQQNFDSSGVIASRTVYEAPQLDDPNGKAGGTGTDANKVAYLGRNSTVAANVPRDNPNRFASEWILGRHVTLLAQPRSTYGGNLLPGTLSTLYFFGLPEYYQYDSKYQIGLQPAAASVFRTIARRPLNFYTTGNRLTTAYLPRGVNNFAVAGADPSATSFVGPPMFSSGIVDIATTDLTEIRNTVDQCWDNVAGQLIVPGRPDLRVSAPNDIPPSFFRGPRPDAASSLVNGRSVNGPTYVSLPTPSSLARPQLTSLQRGALIDAMQAFMSDAMPTESRQDAKLYPALLRSADEAAAADWQGVRMRAETSAPDLATVFSDTVDTASGTPITTDDAQQTQLVRLTDQNMLSASNILPHCSEFIVDWSFGQKDKNGELIWHGLPRTTQVNGVDVGVTRPYPFAPDIADTIKYPMVRKVPLNNGNTLSLVTPPRLIYGTTPDVNTKQVSLTSYFGYSDPTYPNVYGTTDLPVTRPADPSIPLPPSTDSKIIQAQNAWLESGVVSYPVPWPWPTLVRVTVTMADPVDGSLETTFQFVFRVPEADAVVGAE